ncbi:MAG TPA: sulfatase-like hydrolase/transferase, partial [Bryobacteraceae bacterium]|nr:sulfatase-like hydrolase/transferase [Bryobacteraceae bacterium]
HMSRLPKSAGPRVLWIIFDEWDQGLTFDNRPDGLHLPALDRLRRESLYAGNALPPADATIVSMPSLIEGRVVRVASPIDAETMELKYMDGSTQRFADEPNLFSEVRRSGMNAAVYGWYLPYCRALGAYLCDCWWQDFSSPLLVASPTFGSALLNQPRRLIEPTLFSPFGPSLSAHKHQRTFEELLARSKRVAADPDVRLALVHFNVPHAPFIYERATGGMTFSNSVNGYSDALALVDKTIGGLRASMEQSGTWDSVTVLFSADHFYRGSPLVNGVRDRRVPFLVHFPASSSGLTYMRPFNTVLTHDLILALLHSEITSAASTRDWLDRHNQ